MSTRMTDSATAAELRELFSMDADEALADRIPVCAGVWVRRSEDQWDFEADEDWL